MINDTLISLGLTYNESKIYLCLNAEHELSASDITKKTGIHRRNVYDALNRLVDKGIVSQTSVNNKLTFSAVNPTHLLNIARENEKNIQSILPGLKSAFENSPMKNSVKVYKGVKGIKACFTESTNMMNKGDKYRAMGCYDMTQVLGDFIEHNHDERAKKQISTWDIFNYESLDRAKAVSKKPNHHIRVLPKNHSLPVETIIFGEKIVCQIFIHGEPFVIQVIDEKFAATYKEYFNMLWKISQSV
ncbi:hypothetical protein HYT24_00140 [Candidatus Pacearchaeota archaeon]|nr:hypothetical protein [Candidatus Pacearchaeota archaeon]